ncbi:hypothetical protein M9Y10_032916 [Tritrichomonas musculus]|uniref:DUF3447 domain-containing protein n=1 Tax=Tritrichomonas musculus TaxID=1915356 RepID=A0ABR2GY62_9EUKA
MILYLFQNKIFTIDDSIAKILIDKNDFCYCLYFFNEIKSYLSDQKLQEIEGKINELNDFEKKSHNGENDSYICTLIRNDSVEEFVSFVNQSNLPLSTTIKYSILETNQFLLLNQNTSLIEYAAFFGKIHIFQYLRMNGLELSPSIQKVETWAFIDCTS